MYYVYILANRRNGTLYVGITSDLLRRVHEHKNDLVEGFTSKYHIHRLVYYESCQSIDGAIIREKQVKRWKREWKIRMIEEQNASWEDLYDEVVASGFLPSQE